MNRWQTTPSVDVPRSTFDLSHGHKTAFDAGWLIPVYSEEVLPGDTFNVKLTGFGRMTTPIKPIMDNLYFDCHFWFVPLRLLWDHFEQFMGERKNPDDSIDYICPQVECGEDGYPYETLFDYLGIEPMVPNRLPIAYYSRAYNLIYNEWYRDQNLIPSIPVDTDDGPDNPNDYIVRRFAKRHDPFTSCLIAPQKGEPVYVPLGESAPIKYDVISGNSGIDNSYTVNRLTNTAGAEFGYNTTYGLSAQSSLKDDSTVANLYADISEATSASVNEWRTAFQIQKFYEREARGGTRYIEILRSMFGVISPDYRLQRPELLGSGTSMVNINPIVQTSQTDSTPLGNLSAMGTVAMNRIGFTSSFTEHGVILGIGRVRSDVSYQQGMHKRFMRETRFDYYWPLFTGVGEQAVLNCEIYQDSTDADFEVFGYQERHYEYKYRASYITGKMRSKHPTPVDIWHLAQNFETRPALNQTFIEENPPMSRVLAVTNEPQFLFDFWFDVRATRPMPTYSVPGNIDHF